MDIQWPLVFFTLLTGLGAGTFAVVAAGEWRGKSERTRMPGAITALVALFAGGVASTFHLGHLERIFNALGHFGSGIMLEMLLVGLTGLAALVYIVMLRTGYSAQIRKIVAAIGLVFAVITSFAVGYSYVLPARPAWNTLLLPLVYLASAVVLGCFTMYVWTVLRKEDAPTLMTMNRATLIALAVQAFLILAYVVYLAAAPFQNPTRSVTRILIGDLAPVFWIGLVLIGILVPFFLTIQFLTTKKPSFSPMQAAVAGLICVIVGGLAFRAPMYLLGSSIEQFF
jgi:anaerobic dimethyl sulfoxide reductase subunit C (anchor subunit)